MTKSTALSFSTDGYDFINDLKARALLKMPGCYPVAVNGAHFGSFKIPFATVQSSIEIDKALTIQGRLWSQQKSDSESYCYCFPIKAVISLISRHCVFERNFQFLRGKPHKWRYDIAAFLLNQNQKERIYELYQVECRWFKQPGVEFLEVIYSKLLDLKITVETLKSAKNGAASLVKATTNLDGMEFIDAITADVSGEEGYNFVYDSFASALSDLSRGISVALVKKRVLAEIKAKDELVDYEAVHGFVNGIFGYIPDSTKIAKTRKEIVDDLRGIQNRLFDANVLVDGVVKTLSPELKKWPVIEFDRERI